MMYYVVPLKRKNYNYSDLLHKSRLWWTQTLWWQYTGLYIYSPAQPHTQCVMKDMRKQSHRNIPTGGLKITVGTLGHYTGPVFAVFSSHFLFFFQDHPHSWRDAVLPWY